MDTLGHILWLGYFKGFAFPLVLGTIFPDLCLNLFILKHRKLPDDRFEHWLWIQAERLHSIFLVAVVCILSYLSQNIWFISFAFGWAFHVGIDLLMHKREGARYFYPFLDRKCRVGLFHWQTKKFVIANYAVLLGLYAFRYIRH